MRDRNGLSKFSGTSLDDHHQNTFKPCFTTTTKTLHSETLHSQHTTILKHYIHNTPPKHYIHHHQNTFKPRFTTTTKTLSNLALLPPPKHFQTSLFDHLGIYSGIDEIVVVSQNFSAVTELKP